MTAFFALALPLVVVVLAVRHLAQRRAPRAAIASVVLVVAGLGVDAVAARVVLPGAPLAEGTLKRGEALALPAVDVDEVLIADAPLADGTTGAARGTYRLSLTDTSAHALATLEGGVEQHTERRKVKRGSSVPVVVAHNETQLALPPAARAGGSVTLTAVDGAAAEPVHVVVRTADPPLGVVAGGAALLLLLLALLLRGAHREQALPALFPIAAAPVYLIFLEAGPHPPALGSVGVIAVGAAVSGAVVSGLVSLLPLFAPSPRELRA